MIVFRKKYKRGMEIMRQKNREYLEKLDPALFDGEEAEREEKKSPEPSDLEKNDMKAIILSAFLVFGPIILILLLVLLLVWFLMR